MELTQAFFIVLWLGLLLIDLITFLKEQGACLDSPSEGWRTWLRGRALSRICKAFVLVPSTETKQNKRRTKVDLEEGLEQVLMGRGAVTGPYVIEKHSYGPPLLCWGSLSLTASGGAVDSVRCSWPAGLVLLCRGEAE